MDRARSIAGTPVVVGVARVVVAVGLAAVVAATVPAVAVGVEGTGTSAPAGSPGPEERLEREVTLPLAAPVAAVAIGDEVLVTGDDQVVAVRPDGDVRVVAIGLPGAGPLVAADEAGRVHVGLASTPPAVVTLEVATGAIVAAHDLPAWPRSLLGVPDGVLVGTGRGGEIHRLHHLDLRDGHLTSRDLPRYPELTRDGDEVIAARGPQPGRLERLDTTGSPLAPAIEQVLGGTIVDLAVDAASGRLWVAGSQIPGPTDYRVHHLDAATLTPVGDRSIGAHPNAVSPLGDGEHVALARRTSGGDDVLIDRAGVAPVVASFDVRGVVADRGLATLADGTLAVLSTGTALASGGWVTFVPEPTLASGVLTLTPPASRPADEPLTVAVSFLGSVDHPDRSVPLTFTDPLGRSVTVISDAEGVATATLPGAPGAGPWRVTVTHAGRAGERPLARHVDVAVSRRTSTLTLAPLPEAPRALDTLTVAGRVLDPEPVVGQPVRAEVTAGGVTATVEGVTEADGAFALDVPTTRAGTHAVVVRAVQDERNTAATSATRHVVLRHRGTHVDVTLTGSHTAGHPATIAGQVRDEDGEGRPGVTVALRAAGVDLGPVTTAADGTFQRSHTPPSPAPADDPLVLRASVVEGAAHLGSQAESTVTVAADRVTQSLTTPSGTAGSAVALTGTVRDSLGRPVVGRDVLVRVTDAHQVGVVRQPVTDANGRWATSFTPRNGGSHTLRVEFAAGDAFAASAASRTFSVARLATAVTLGALPSTVDHGATLTLSARLTTPRPASLDLVAVDLASGTERRIARATTDEHGRLRRDVVARATTRYEVRFRGDARHAPSTARATVRVRPVVTATVSGHDRTVDGVASFPRGARPTVSGRVRSATPETRVTLRLERWDGSAWVVRDTWRVTPGTDGRLTTRTPRQLSAGTHRVRIEVPSTPSNVAGRSAWVRLRVR